MTLRLRFGVAAAVVVILFAALGLIVPRVVATSQIQQVDQQLLEAVPRALVVARGTKPPDRRSLPKDSPLRLDVDERFSNVYIAEVTSTQRHVLVSLSDEGAEPRLPTVVSGAGNARPVIQTVASVTGSSRWRAALVRHDNGPEVLVAVSLASVDATDGQLRLALLLAGLALLIIMAALGWWLVRLGLQPIAEVTTVADAIAAGDRSRRVREPHRGSEAAHLARAFNVMLDEEQSSEERLRRFVSDASHELRTPVTVIQGLAELWREGALADADAINDALRRVGQEGERMAALVQDLLLLARLDEGHLLALDRVNLSQLAREVLSSSAGMYSAQDVVAEIDDDVMTTGDETRLRQVLDNLLRNAFLHTPAGTLVRLRVQRDGDGSLLDVADDGPGMESADASHAFDRFWRGSRARSGTGSGLGLSIVAGIVASHDGTVEMITAPGQGTRVRVTLPSAAPTPSGRTEAAPVVAFARKREVTMSDVMGGAEPDEPDVMGGEEPDEPDVMGGEEPDEPDVMGGEEPDEPDVMGGEEPDEPDVMGE